MANKVEFGLSNVHYAPYEIVNGSPVYDTPIPIPGAVTLTGDPIGESSNFYADNIIYYVANSNQGYEFTLSIALIPQQFAIDALGEEYDAGNGLINELADAQGKPFALLWQFEGDASNTLHLAYNCTANRPSISGNTKEDSTEISPNELTLVAAPIAIGDKTIVKTKTTANTPSTVKEAWFDSVHTGSAVDVTSVDVVPATVTLAVGAVQQLGTTVLPANASNQKIVYTTSDATKATVDSKGRITAVASGEATITATSAADSTKSDTCVVTVA